MAPAHLIVALLRTIICIKDARDTRQSGGHASGGGLARRIILNLVIAWSDSSTGKHNTDSDYNYRANLV